MAEKCPLEPDHGIYSEVELPAQCIGCIAIAQETNKLRPLPTRLTPLTDNPFVGQDPADLYGFQLIGLDRGDESSRRMYIVEHFISTDAPGDTPPKSTHIDTFEFDCQRSE